jgi:hypothetical protein
VGPIQEVGSDADGLSLLNPRLLDLNSTEQSENVYENKGRLWETPPGKCVWAVREPPLRLRAVALNSARMNQEQRTTDDGQRTSFFGHFAHE